MKSLRTLNLEHTKVTDAGLKELAGMKSLRSLDLSCTAVTASGLKELKELKSMQSFSLLNTEMTYAHCRDQPASSHCKWYTSAT